MTRADVTSAIRAAKAAKGLTWQESAKVVEKSMDIEKVHDPNGDRVKVTMCGKFLPYKSW